MTEIRDDTVLFTEPGARWRSVAYGPVLCLIVLIVEITTSSPVHWFALIFCAVLIAGFVWLQVLAGRRHVSVELTDSDLRQGTETLPLSGIAEVLPERDDNSWDDEDWESARALGELTGVPRRRTGIGLRLRAGGFVQAWARDHRGLRRALTAALEGPSDTVDSAAAESASGDPVDVDQVPADRVSVDKADEAGVDQADVDRASVDQAGNHHAEVDKTATDEAAGDEAAGDQAVVDQAGVGRAAVGKVAVAEQGASGVERDEQNGADR